MPLKHFISNESFKLLTTEIFGPFQVVTEYDDSDIDKTLEIFERVQLNLTAAVVSNDIAFRHKILGNTINGTSYSGIRARTTGTPQHFWFGPAGDPRVAGIGTREAIKNVWSVHRGIVSDDLPISKDWKMPSPT